MFTPGDVRRSGNPNRDYLEPGQDRWSLTGPSAGGAVDLGVLVRLGLQRVGGSRRGQLPYAAVDGSPESQWVTDPAQIERPWWQIRLDRPTRVASVQLTGGASAVASQEVRW